MTKGNGNLLLTKRLQQLCGKRFVSFAEFMNLALYDANDGYYSNCHKIFGREGDYTTAPHISKAFAYGLFQVLRAQTLSLINNRKPATVYWIEPASADGRLAIDLFTLWQNNPINGVSIHYHAIEPMPSCRNKWWQNINTACSKTVNHDSWQWDINEGISCLPNNITGIVFANELFDALPCEVLEWGDNKTVLQKGVAWNKERGFYWTNRAINKNSDLLARALSLPPSIGSKDNGWAAADFQKPYIHEINLAMEAWVSAIMNKLSIGYAVFFDYGDNQANLYHPSRHQGTLKSIRHHQISESVWEHIGKQDITAHIDFSALARIATKSGGTLLGQTSQAAFLVAAGLDDWFATIPSEPLARMQAIAGFRQLIEPAIMGTAIQVIAWSVGVPESLICSKGF